MRRVLVLLFLAAFVLAGCELAVPLSLPPIGLATTVAPAPAGGTLTVVFLDVGQGDAILVRAPSGMTMLIDGGHDESDGTRIIIPQLKAWGATQLDVLVATHPDADHISGLPAVVRYFPVKNAALTGQVHTTLVYERLLTDLRDFKVHSIRTRRGTVLPFDPAVALTVLGPDDAEVKNTDDTNNASIVIKLVYGQVSFLFTGDMELAEAQAIQASGGDLSATVLKLGHHGSRTSTNATLLRIIHPQIGVISVGMGNRFGHPHAEVLDALERQHVRVYRTDENGTITITTDGVTPAVQTEK